MEALLVSDEHTALNLHNFFRKCVNVTKCTNVNIQLNKTKLLLHTILN